MAVDYDPELIGKVFEVTDPVDVSAEDIARFCTAMGETNPLYTDEAAAKNGRSFYMVDESAEAVAVMRRRLKRFL